MKIHQITVTAALSALIISPLAMAERPHQQRHSFSADISRSDSANRVMHRHTEQVAEAHSFRRESTLTTDNGKTASRVVTGSYDPDSHTHTRAVNGSRLDGGTYSSQRTTQKTENGYLRSESRTNAAGETATRRADVVIDKENHTVTKNITATGFNGETHSATVVKTFNRGEPRSTDG